MSTWREIAEHLRQRIDAGDYKVDTRLPKEIELADEFSVSRSTIHRAMEQLEGLGYIESRKRAGTFVRKGVRPQRHMVALIFDRVAKNLDFPASEMIAGIKETLGDQYGLVLCDSKGSIEREANFLLRMSKQTDGVICFPIADQRDGTFIEKLHQTGFPIVTIDRIPVGYTGSSVVSDDYDTTIQSIAMLKKHGHQNIGFLGFRKETVTSAMARYEAYLDGMKECFGIDADEYVRWIGQEFEWNGDLLQKAVDDIVFAMVNGPQKITAIYCLQDELAMRTLSVADRLGISIPDQLEIVTINEWPPLELRRPWDMHRIVRKKYRIGIEAARLLQEQMKFPRGCPESLKVQADFLPSMPQNNAISSEVTDSLIQLMRDRRN